jgi:hypothetical protein
VNGTLFGRTSEQLVRIEIGAQGAGREAGINRTVTHQPGELRKRAWTSTLP